MQFNVDDLGSPLAFIIDEANIILLVIQQCESLNVGKIIYSLCCILLLVWHNIFLRHFYVPCKLSYCEILFREICSSVRKMEQGTRTCSSIAYVENSIYLENYTLGSLFCIYP